MVKLNENKGILLISTLVIATVLSVFSTAYISSSLVQNQAVQRGRVNLQSFYAAEKGIEYAYIESQNNLWSWRTHQISANDEDDDGLFNDLIPQGAAPGVTLDGAFINPASDCRGCYTISTSSGTVEVKTYPDPDNPDETIVLSRNTNGSASRILKFRITRLSLYRYFYYFPGDKTFSYMTFNGQGAGGIYVNGNIGLGNNLAFNNITELSTNENGSFFLNYFQYSQPYLLDNKRIWTGSAWSTAIDGKAPLPRINSPYNYSNNNGPPNIYTTRDGYFYPWGNGNWPPYSFPPKDWWTVNAHFSGTDNPSNNFMNIRVNGITLPRRLSTNWEWNKYSGATVPASERPVKFVDENGQEPDPAYWNNLATIVQSMGGEAMFDSAFWTNKTYQRTPSTVQVNYLNTDKQVTDWQAWLDSTGINLQDVVQEKNTGGYNTAAPNIQVSYSVLAKEAGLYIGQDDSGQTEVYLNGENKGGVLPGWVTDNVQFFNTVRPKDRDGDGAVDKENVLQLNMAESLTSSELPNNGIIYIASKNVRLADARKLPQSLTIVSPYNIYLKGDYNTDSEWRPSSVITNSLVYLLSNNFNDPQALPATLSARENPNEQRYFTQAYFTPGPTYNRPALTNEIKSFFGLSDFNITAGAGDFVALVKDIRAEYNREYESQKPNIASSTTYNVAIASPFEPSGYELERWAGSATPTIKGAFLQLNNSSWANDANGNPIRDVLVNASGQPTQYNGKRTGGPNDFPLNSPNRDPNPMYNSPALINSKNPVAEYEGRFPTEPPAGNFFLASQPLWEEVSDFDHDIDI